MKRSIKAVESEPKAPKVDPCILGRSYGRKKENHNQGAVIKCYRCGDFMGCRWCCESAGDLVCLRCNNWANRRGVQRHGDVMPSEKVKRVNTDRGWRDWEKEKPAASVGVMVKKITEGVNHGS